MPTWWGPTSVNDVGKSLIRYISEEFILLFRPHPSTPQEVIDGYKRIIDTEKFNAFYLPEGNEFKLTIDDILIGSDVFIGDMSSVVLEAMLTKKPILIAYGSEDRRQDERLYAPINQVITQQPPITSRNVSAINQIIDDALKNPIDNTLYDTCIGNVFYGTNGDTIDVLIRNIKQLT